MDRSIRDAFPELLNIWTVLEALTVSFDRIGAYQALRDPDGGPAALAAFIEPKLVQRIAAARAQVAALLRSADPEVTELLEHLAENEDAIGYWQGQGATE